MSKEIQVKFLQYVYEVAGKWFDDSGMRELQRGESEL